jgi:hypothetical protein
MTGPILSVAEIQAEAETHKKVMAIRRAVRIETKRQARETVAARIAARISQPTASASS